MEFARISDRVISHVEHNRMIFCQKPPDARPHYLWPEMEKHYLYVAARADLFVTESLECRAGKCCK